MESLFNRVAARFLRTPILKNICEWTVYAKFLIYTSLIGALRSYAPYPYAPYAPYEGLP